MNKKNILVLGAAQSCLGIIRTIKAMGHNAVVVANSINLPGIDIADQYFITDDNNVESVVNFCKNQYIHGIVPTPVDRPLVWMAQVAEKLGLRFISPEVAKVFRNKFLMKEALNRAGVNCAKGFLTTPSKFNLTDIERFQFPLIVKPIDGYASRGVQKANNGQELVEFLEEASSFSSDGTFVIEEFIEGREFNAEGLCYNGKVEIYAIVEKISDPFPRTIEMGHIIPPSITKKEETIIVKTVTNAVIGMGMDNGAFNAEIKIHNGIANIIEVNGRLAGDFIISHLIKPTTGQDYEEGVVNIALGIKPDPARRNYVKHGIISFYNLEAGKRIKEIKDFNHLHNDPKVVWAYLFFKKNDIIPEVKHMGHRSGFVIVLGNTRKEMFDVAEKTKKKILQHIIFYD